LRTWIPASASIHWLHNALFRRAKSAAAEQGITFRELVSEALAEKLRVQGRKDKPWLKAFGKLRSLRKESASIKRIIGQEFGHIEPRDSQ
jgi:hypothetical protein